MNIALPAKARVLPDWMDHIQGYKQCSGMSTTSPALEKPSPCIFDINSRSNILQPDVGSPSTLQQTEPDHTVEDP